MKIVGTYRLICSRFSKTFYSETEFSLGQFLSRPGVKLELSRACIDRDYRDGMVIALLWRGLVQYSQEVKANMLFGCASIRSMDTLEVANIYHYLNSKSFLSEEHQIQPLPSYVMPGFEASRLEVQQNGGNVEEGKSLIPPLLNSYLRAGAKVFGAPALDQSFQCVDLFTVLQLDEMSRLFERRYSTS
jgi:putative hemolysin